MKGVLEEQYLRIRTQEWLLLILAIIESNTN